MSSEDNKEKIPIPFTNQKREHFFRPHVRRSKTVLDYILNSGVTGFRILCQWNLDSGFHLLAGFLIRTPQAKISQIPESALPCMRQFLQRPSSQFAALFPYKYTKERVT